MPITKLTSKSGRAILCAAFLVAVGAVEATAQQNNLTMTRPQARVLANQALNAGDLQLAEQLSRGLLQADEKDVTALFVLGNIAQLVGKTDEAVALFKRAYRAADNKQDRYNTSVITAKALDSQGKYERAKLWLRRSVQNAPDDAARANAVRGFQQMRAKSPWRTSLSFGVTPSNNVNNGSGADEICTIFFGCSSSVSDTEPLQGAYISGSFSTEYRLKEARTHKLVAGFDLYHRAAWIKPSEKSKTTKSASDFDFSYIGARLRWDQALSNTTSTTEILTIGRSLYGGSPLTDKIGVEKTFNFRLAPTKNIGLSFGLSRERNHVVEARASTQQTISMPYSVLLGNKDRVRITPTIKNVVSSDPQTAHRSGSLMVAYTPATPTFNIHPTFTLSMGLREDRDSSIFGTGGVAERRRDNSFGLSVSFALPAFEVYGFAPVAVIEARKTSSNISLYDTSSVSSRIEFRSSF